MLQKKDLKNNTVLNKVVQKERDGEVQKGNIWRNSTVGKINVTSPRKCCIQKRQYMLHRIGSTWSGLQKQKVRNRM